MSCCRPYGTSDQYHFGTCLVNRGGPLKILENQKRKERILRGFSIYSNLAHGVDKKCQGCSVVYQTVRVDPPYVVPRADGGGAGA